MAGLRHIFQTATAERKDFTSTHQGGGKFKTPPRDDRVKHGGRLLSELQRAVADSTMQADPLAEESRPQGLVLEFEGDPGFKLKLESLERQQSGIELLNVRTDETRTMRATVYVPRDKVNLLERTLDRYIREDFTNKKTGEAKPKNKDLVESVTKIRSALLEKSYWTDASSAYPGIGEQIWWEVWLRDEGEQAGTVELFRSDAELAGLRIGQRLIRFPERLVMLAYGTLAEWATMPRLSDYLAELRRAKSVPSEFLSLTPREQAALVAKALERIKPPGPSAPAVCLLDTGVNRGHPLLALAIGEEHLLSCDPNWSGGDSRGHGTELAGLGLYGCLTEIFSSAESVVLRHRVESVKILPNSGDNPPDNYGAITAEAVARAEIVSPTRNRAVCMAITADSRDEGYPSAWSAAVDQLCAGALDSRHRLVFISTGNATLDAASEYPARNQVEGIQDPSQSWNAITVGAFTEKTTIREEANSSWTPVAPAGGLCPSSRTSLVWGDKAWPFKPDIVMEGGNKAIDPSTGRAEFVDDLSLLTTRLSAAGALLTTTGETSGATVQAARLAAMVYAEYPQLWPETVRALVIHSARWTPRMLQEFPAKDRDDRLRCYGYGVPDGERALWSLRNAATLIVEESLQPFDRQDGNIKTKEMHLHHLKWPKSILQSLGDLSVTMRITLSYFIEPSPGRRGWTTKHRYQSHGLRFDVKRPSETLDAFRKRISRTEWDSADKRPSSSYDDRTWELGPTLRTKGSVHSDTWHGLAAELAECGIIAVHPVTGWWRERPHLDRWSRSARYALVVSIETAKTEIDLYTPIATLVTSEQATEMEIDSERQYDGGVH